MNTAAWVILGCLPLSASQRRSSGLRDIRCRRAAECLRLTREALSYEKHEL
jgi:hypothetical protein